MPVNKKSIMTRYSLITLVMALTGVIIIIKAGITMFAERDYWQAVADRFKKENVIVKPNRGNIISSDGKLMASSLPEYQIYMDFQAGGEKKDTMMINHMDEICEGLHKIFPDKSAKEFKQHLLKGRKKKSRNYLIYPKRVSYIQYKEAKRLPVFNLTKYKGGFHELAFNQRKQPFGSLATRTLGRVFAAKDSAVNGLELSFDSILKGRNGITHRQKVMNKYLNITDVPPVDGCDIITTIDVGMQDIAEKALVDKLKEIDANVGVALLMEVSTGEVKAIVNMTKCSDGVYREIKNNAISDMMEPGSVFKTAALMVGLEDGVISPDDGVDTGNGVMMMHGRPMKDHNWRRGGYQYLTLPQILMYSSNIGVSYLIDKHYFDNPDKFVDGIYRIGINQPLHLQIPGEGTPNIRRPKDGRWSKTALAWMSIGYETQIPPMNVLTFYNAIANNGVMVRPKFVKAIARNGEILKEYPTEIMNPAICSPKTLKIIQDMLEMVVSKGLGKSAGSKQFHVSGKTGTAQVSQGAKGYKSGQVNYLLSFAGYFPSETPQYSCMVAIQKSGTPASSGWSAQVFSKIAERVYAKNLTDNLANAIDSNSVVIPNVKAGDVNKSKYILDALKIQNQPQFTLAKSDKPIWGSAQVSPNAVILSHRDILRDFVPSVIGMGAKDAVYLLESKGLRVNLSGVGKVYSQSISQGTLVRKGQTIGLILK
ncbi:PASTA domain-containing protein [Bacteroides sp. AF16-49]|jgi:cell division protein FtsI (penicillin-binding protein 3)|nr:PASTA domain-containing protein [Bacteroides sp. OM05-12]RHR77344.1 PASTA domain-containing protein [Bacteroides sp. AF16-49]